MPPSSALDDLTGGLISEFGVAVDELTVALKTVARRRLLTFKDIFGAFDTCVQKGWSENAFLWSDMSHYRRHLRMCQNLVKQAERLRDSTDGPRGERAPFPAVPGLRARATPPMSALTRSRTRSSTSSAAARSANHPQRHHLIENHIDAWNYKQTGSRTAGSRPTRGAHTDTYPELSMSALHYAVQMTPENPARRAAPETRCRTTTTGRKKALDVDGELPDWMCDAIVQAMIATFADEPAPDDLRRQRLPGPRSTRVC